MAEGRAFFEAGKLTEALVAFREAYEAEGTPQQAANLGTIELLLGDHRAAAKYLQLSLIGLESGPRDDKIDRAIAEVRRSFEQATRAVGAIEVHVNVPSAVVELDRSKIDLSTSSVIFVEPGRHVLSAVAAAHSPAREELKLVAGERRRVELTLVATEPVLVASQAPIEASRPVRPLPASRPLGPAVAAGAGSIVGVTAGAVLLIFAEDQGALAQKGARDLRARRALCQPTTSGFEAACQQIEDAADAHNTLQRAGVGAFVVGGAALLAGATYLLWSPSSPSTAQIQAAPLVGWSIQGAMVRTRF
jgi:hypothetical protein